MFLVFWGERMPELPRERVLRGTSTTLRINFSAGSASAMA
jgi:hypothetical protein